MDFNRRNMLKGAAALAGAGSLTLITSAGTASAATQPVLKMGSHGSAVVVLQRRLSALGYWLGAADGAFGNLTWQAVVAIQKVSGISRDGVCGPVTWARVNSGVKPRVRTRRGHMIEVNKTTQTLMIVDAGVVKRTYNTSTGSGLRYLSMGVWHTALTPVGSFHVTRRVNGWDDGPLGKLYRPQYFNGGIAVHGLASVPATPASHGCCRVSLKAMDSLWAAGGMSVGTGVLVY